MKDDPCLAFSVSTTTRTRREGEVDGESYYYIDDAAFKTMIDAGEFVEWAKVHTHYYGTTKKEIDRIRAAGKIPVFDVDVQGARNLRENIDDAVLIFILPPSIDSLVERLRQRNTESEEELTIRVSNAIRELREYRNYDYFIINDRLEDAIADAKSVIRAELLKRERMCAKVGAILEEEK
jgi:guanylate kinase